MRTTFLLCCLFPGIANAGWVELDRPASRHGTRTLVDSQVLGAGDFDPFSPGEEVVVAAEWTRGATVLHTVYLGRDHLELSPIEGDFPFDLDAATEIGDFDGDGLDDLFVDDRGGREVLLRSEDAFEEVPWSAPFDTRRGPPSTDCGIGDVNGDGLDDVARTVTAFGDTVTPWWQVSTGWGFHPWSDRLEARSDARCVGVGDVDGDGHDEIVFQQDRDGRRSWLVQGYDGAWTSTTTPNVEVIGIEDFDGDGRDDLWVQYDHRGQRYWQVRLSTGSAFSIRDMPQTSTKTPNVRFVGIGDADGDGRGDLWLEYDHRGTRRWQVRRSTGTGFSYNGDWTSTRTRGVEVLAIADADGDGRDDLWIVWDTPSGDVVRRRFQLRPSTGSAFGTPIGGAELDLGRQAVLVQGREWHWR